MYGQQFKFPIIQYMHPVFHLCIINMELIMHAYILQKKWN